ncbi:MAG: hypothetical protein C0598_00930 [Marinilabiliales bacterium]|nr:MAG: hypothetical protein C0598_00930 [Marinilabiliales bacterium]
MKLLLMYCTQFNYKPVSKTLEEFPEENKPGKFKDILLAFIHAEEKDEEDAKSIENKLLKNLKWAAKKNNTNNIILHSFAHLAITKANPHFTKDIFDKVEKRLKNADYEAAQTPFGYFLDIDLKATGVSQARIFKEF